MAMQIKIKSTPQVWLSPLAAEKMNTITMAVETEVAWLGFCSWTTNKTGMLREVLVEDVIVPPQEVSSASADQTVAGLTALASTLSVEQLQKLRFWGHSHAKMQSVSPSGTDTATCAEFGEGGLDWLLWCITNRHGDCQFNLDHFGLGVSWENIAWEIRRPPVMTAEQHADLLADLEVKLTKPAYQSAAVTHYGSYLGHQDEGGWWDTELGKDNPTQALLEKLPILGRGKGKTGGREFYTLDELNGIAPYKKNAHSFAWSVVIYSADNKEGQLAVLPSADKVAYYQAVAEAIRLDQSFKGQVYLMEERKW